MGDARYQAPYDRLKQASVPAQFLHAMSSEDVIAALAAASREKDPFLANVLATEAHNRLGREGAAMEWLGHGLYIVDAAARVVYVNRAAAHLLQRPEDEILGRPARDVVALRDGTLANGDVHWPEEIALQTGRAIATETGVIKPTGEGPDILVAYSAAPLRREGEVTGVVVAFHDITARRRAQDALARSEARLRLLLATIPDAILVLDLGGFVRYANPAAHDLFGRAESELVGAFMGIPSESVQGAEVDVSAAGGHWRLARQRTIPSEWEDAPAFLSMYSEVSPAARPVNTRRARDSPVPEPPSSP